MKYRIILGALAAAATLSSCISEEPLNMECDIEQAELIMDNPLTLFYHDYDACINEVPLSSDSIRFMIRPTANAGEIPLRLTTTPGSKVYRAGEATPFENGTPVDFSDERQQQFRVVSEDGQWERHYRIFLRHEQEQTNSNLYFDFANYELEPKGKYYIWKAEGEAENLWTDGEWKNGNPGFKISRSGAKLDEYPTIPIPGGGPDGSDCVKLETCSTGSFGVMANMRLAAGSFFNGIFDVSNALSDALAATRFGSPFKHKPISFSLWMKWEPGETFQDKDGKTIEGVIDEPDCYVILYRNTDPEGNPIMLDGNDVLTSPYIIGKARMPHRYNPDGSDQLTADPIHGITSEWAEYTYTLEYTQEPDPEILAANGYNLIVGFASSWQGAYFKGAVGSKFWIDNVKVNCQ